MTGSYFSDGCRKLKSRERENMFSLMGQNQDFHSMTQAIEEHSMDFQGLFNYTYAFAKEDQQEKKVKSNQPTLSSLTKKGMPQVRNPIVIYTRTQVCSGVNTCGHVVERC